LIQRGYVKTLGVRGDDHAGDCFIPFGKWPILVCRLISFASPRFGHELFRRSRGYPFFAYAFCKPLQPDPYFDVVAFRVVRGVAIMMGNNGTRQLPSTPPFPQAEQIEAGSRGLYPGLGNRPQ